MDGAGLRAVKEFRRASWWRFSQVLVTDGTPVGSIGQHGWWRTRTVADLPGLPLPVQVFSLVVVLTMWDSQAAAAAGV